MRKNNILRQEDLSEKQLLILRDELESKRKSVGLTYLLYIFFGILGIHKFYLEKKKKGIIYVFLSFIGYESYNIGSTFSVYSSGIKNNLLVGLEIFGIVLLVILGLLLLRDLFTIPQQINKLEEEYKEKIISEFENKTNRDD